MLRGLSARGKFQVLALTRTHARERLHCRMYAGCRQLEDFPWPVSEHRHYCSAGELCALTRGADAREMMGALCVCSGERKFRRPRAPKDWPVEW